MLRNTNELLTYDIAATDGSLGRIRDFYFEVSSWHVHDLIVDTRKWLPGRSVLITPETVRDIDGEHHRMNVNLTRDQVRHCPDSNSEKTITRQHEEHMFLQYSWPHYWGVPIGPEPGNSFQFLTEMEDEHEEPVTKGPALYSVNELVGYRVDASDGPIGTVEDYLIDDTNWNVNFLVVDMNKWMPGVKFLASHEAIESVNWNRSRILLKVSREQIKADTKDETEEEASHPSDPGMYDFFGFQDM